MSLSSLERRLLEYVTPTPQSATEIYRNFYALPPGNLSFTTKMKHQRRETGARLEDLVSAGLIVRGTEERHGVTVVVFSR